MSSKISKVPHYLSKTSQRRGGIVDRNVRFKCFMQNVILDVFKQKGWTEVTENDWDIFWCDVGWMKDYFDHSYFEEHMKINHFRNHYELTRKNLMVKNLKRFCRLTQKESGKLNEFFPMTYELPSEYHIFVEWYKRNQGQIWIMKPIAKSQGKGIFLFRRLKDIVDWKKGEYLQTSLQSPDAKAEMPETYVVQRYIQDPYLVGGRKFDLRVYVLVTSYVPLKAWLYRSGFARFANTRYSMETIDDSYVHLTNVAIQKLAPDYDPEKGSKWSIQQLRRFMTHRHGHKEVSKCFDEMSEIFVKSLQSVQKIMINDKHCFELYGYDILVDESFKPWLIEVNASPSLTASSNEDYQLKYALLDDVISVIDLENKLTGKERQIGGFDVLWEDGLSPDEEHELMQSYLGCNINRKKKQNEIIQELQGKK